MPATIWAWTKEGQEELTVSDDDLIADIIEKAHGKMRIAQRGMRGQTMMPQDSADWWIAKEALSRSSAEIGQLRNIIGLVRAVFAPLGTPWRELYEALRDYDNCGDGETNAKPAHDFESRIREWVATTSYGNAASEVALLLPELTKDTPPDGFITPEQLCEQLFGPGWRTDPDYVKAKQWVRENLSEQGTPPCAECGEPAGKGYQPLCKRCYMAHCGHLTEKNHDS